MWDKRSYLLQPLTALTSNKAKFKWTHVEQKAFDEFKGLVTHDTLLIYPYFNECFDIHMDASEFEIGVMINQKGKTISLYRCKLAQPQQRYTVTENELISLV